MELIIGLGNPGKEYAETRHNAGWRVLDILASKCEPACGRANINWTNCNKCQAEYCKVNLEGKEIELLKPLTYMNNSGVAVACRAKNHSLKAEDILVVYDDLDLPLGKIRLGFFKSAAGHNGIKSVIEHLRGANFLRLRIGIKPEARKKIIAEKFVMQKFSSSEKNLLLKALNTAVKAIEDLASMPLDKVMNRFN